ncbi:MAG: response regulator transcription factor [Mariniblastus sp.]
MNAETQKHILVVEDEEHLAVGIKFNLEAEGFLVTAVGNGLAALQAIESESQPVDLVVLDLMLPGMSGYEVCEQIRESGRHMPVLMLSARTLSEDRTRGFDVGANQYLVKPFELKELISRIKNLLSQFDANFQTRRSDAQANSELVEYEFGHAKINFKTYEVTVKEKPVRLTQLQIRVLKYFIEHEGIVIPRAKLLEDVWEMPGHMNTRAPDQILRQLRITFEPNSSKPTHFLTIRDAGYRFIQNP